MQTGTHVHFRTVLSTRRDGPAWPQEYLHTIEVLDSKVAKINGRYNRVQLLSSGNKLTEAADGTVTLNGEPMPIGKKLHSWFQITFSNGSVTGFADWTGKWEISPPIGGSREIEIKLRESQLVGMYGVCCKGRAGKNELTQTRDGVTLNDEELGTGVSTSANQALPGSLTRAFTDYPVHVSNVSLLSGAPYGICVRFAPG